MHSLLSIRDLSKKDIETLILEAEEIKKEISTEKGREALRNQYKNHLFANLIFEDSTRTRTSFNRAARTLGMDVETIAGAGGTSVKKGEPVTHTARMFQGYGCEAAAMRHKLIGAPRLVSEKLNIPVTNAGDGYGEHPTQALLDAFTIKERFGSIDGLKIAMVGDGKYGRTMHSLTQLAEHYNVEIMFVSPEQFAMPQWRINDFEQATGKKATITSNIMDAIKVADVLNMTRFQRERFTNDEEGKREFFEMCAQYSINAEMLKEARRELAVFHPLPIDKSIMEIAYNVENTSHAYYFEQAENGVPMRVAIIQRMLGKGFEGREKSPYKHSGLWDPINLSEKKGPKEQDTWILENGTLIDHIEHGKGLEVLRVLGLDKWEETKLTPGLNINSVKYGKKDIIVIQDVELNDYQLNKLGLVSSTATIAIIENKKVIKKGKVHLPYKLTGEIECQEPDCISNKIHLENVQSTFYVENREPLEVRCNYCATPIVGRENIKLLQ
ncbi:aspartate carbamoyltransferase [Bacteroidota bacterium]